MGTQGLPRNVNPLTSPAVFQVAVSLAYQPLIVNLIVSPSRPPGMVEFSRREGITRPHLPSDGSRTVVSHLDAPIQAVMTVPSAALEPSRTACPEIKNSVGAGNELNPGLITVGAGNEVNPGLIAVGAENEVNPGLITVGVEDGVGIRIAVAVGTGPSVASGIGAARETIVACTASSIIDLMSGVEVGAGVGAGARIVAVISAARAARTAARSAASIVAGMLGVALGTAVGSAPPRMSHAARPTDSRQAISLLIDLILGAYGQRRIMPSNLSIFAGSVGERCD